MMFKFTNLTTVDGIMSQLTDSIKHLEDLGVSRKAKAETAKIKAAAHTKLAELHELEVARAAKVANKLKELIS